MRRVVTTHVRRLRHWVLVGRTVRHIFDVGGTALNAIRVNLIRRRRRAR